MLTNIDQVAAMSEAAAALGRKDADRWLAKAVIDIVAAEAANRTARRAEAAPEPEPERGPARPGSALATCSPGAARSAARPPQPRAARAGRAVTGSGRGAARIPRARQKGAAAAWTTADARRQPARRSDERKAPGAKAPGRRAATSERRGKHAGW